jgi:hypothetical protein
VEDLTGIGFGPEGRIIGRLGTPEPMRNIRFLDALESARDAGFPEILLRDDVRRDLTPAGRDLDILGFEDHRPVGVDDSRGTRLEGYTGVGFTGSRIGTGKFHAGRSSSSVMQVAKTGGRTVSNKRSIRVKT